MKKADRQRVFEMYGGKCAYTGKPLDDKWQIDHIEPQAHYRWGLTNGQPNDISNLLPTIRIINHYKRCKDLELFRTFMMSFHKRLSKLPKKTRVQRTTKRVEYMNKVAELFDISVDMPFTGKFYFETINIKCTKPDNGCCPVCINNDTSPDHNCELCHGIGYIEAELEIKL